MEPTSGLLLAVLALGALAAMAVAVLRRHLVLKAVSGIVALALAATLGIAGVNDYYGYYRSWGQLSADLSGTVPNLSVALPRRFGGAGLAQPVGGTFRQVRINGARSGISRSALVWLPPQYGRPQYAHTRFPVLELFHGDPGHPQNWPVNLQLGRVLDGLLAAHALGPMVVVMPTVNVPGRFVDCVDVPGTAAATYLAQDVPSWMRAHFRVSPDPAEWGLGGFSSGGWCAAELALRYRSAFGASVVMDGYFRPQDGPAGAALGRAGLPLRPYDLLTAAAGLAAATTPLPALWVSAGTGVAGDFLAARAFVAALAHVERVPFAVSRGEGHNFYAWAAVLPRALTWAWQQLAPPDLRVRFPVAGAPQNVRIPPVMPHHHAYRSAHRSAHQPAPQPVQQPGRRLGRPRRA